MGLATRIDQPLDSTVPPESRRATEIALGLMGAGPLKPALFSENASWTRAEGPCLVGRSAIGAALNALTAPASLTILEVTTHGKAATVSGRMTRDGTGLMMFCHVLRFTTPDCRELAQVVSFEHVERRFAPATSETAHGR